MRKIELILMLMVIVIICAIAGCGNEATVIYDTTASTKLTATIAPSVVTANTGSTINFAVACADPDGKATMTLTSVTAKPSTSNAFISNATSTTPSLTGDIAGSYTVSAVCFNDVDTASASTTVSFVTGTTSGIIVQTFALGDFATAPFWAQDDGVRATYDPSAGIAVVKISGGVGNEWMVNFSLKTVSIVSGQTVTAEVTCSNSLSSKIYLKFKNNTTFVAESDNVEVVCDGTKKSPVLTPALTDPAAQLSVNLGETAGTYTFNPKTVVVRR